MAESIELFISYAHEDERYRIELGKHLSALRKQRVITEWHDRKIIPGQDWGREIDARIESAAVILLLVSPDFMHSEYCWDKEMTRALRRHDAGRAVVIPVFIRPVDFEGAPFARVQGLPRDAKPISTWSNSDEAWLDVVRGIRSAIGQLRAKGGISGARAARVPATGRDVQQDPNPSGRREVQPGEQVLHWLGSEGEALREAFVGVFRKQWRAFGNRALQCGGLSDGNDGVQWHAGYDPRSGRRWVGVNLEGLQYRNWPVARLIRNELHAPLLHKLLRSLSEPSSIQVRWERDYWQAASRPPILERAIAPTPVSGDRLTQELWLEALSRAAACLAPSGWGRGTQIVTLSKSRTRVEGPVSPHLMISIESRSPVSWPEFLKTGIIRLQPIYDWAVTRSAEDRTR
jgi:hypothetical protein